MGASFSFKVGQVWKDRNVPMTADRKPDEAARKSLTVKEVIYAPDEMTPMCLCVTGDGKSVVMDMGGMLQRWVAPDDAWGKKPDA